MAKQALQLLKQNRITRVDTTSHLNILLNSEAFSALEIGENAKLLLKFVKMSERVNAESDKLRQLKEVRTLRTKTTMSNKEYAKAKKSLFPQDVSDNRGVASPVSST